MKLKQTLLSLCGIAMLCALTTNLHAQVTIGSAKKPITGALLMLDDGTIDVNDANVNAKKGLGLPRVELQAYDKLKMGATDTEYADKNEHIGLLVYNVNPAFDRCEATSIPSGLHVWDGGKWEGINTEEHKEAIPPVFPAGLFDPNLVNMTSGGEFTIPVRKAYAIWEFLSSKTGSERLPVVDLTGAVTAEIVWQEKNATGAATPTLIIKSGSLSVEGTGRDAKIKLEASGAHGNAVVAVKIGGVIRWSWHVWVTNNPTVGGLNFNGDTWMARNLGSISDVVANAGTKGLLYQWGRATPFPGGTMEPATEWGVNVAQKIYNAAGTEINIVYEARSTDRQANLVTAITKPLVFLTTNDNNNDWYSYNETDASERWDYRWTTDKLADTNCPTFMHDIPTAFDPCNRGWRIPVGKNNHGSADTDSPWNGLTKDNGIWNNGYNWTDPATLAGYYPASGFHSGINGSLHDVGSIARYWSASPGGDLARNLFFFSGSVYPGGSDYSRAYGFSVRCVKK